MDSIKLQVVLADMEEKKTPDGKIKTFAIKFFKKDGEMVYLLRAISCGLHRMNLKKSMMRGVVAVDKENNWIGHPTPVNIWFIADYNGYKVTI